MSGRGLKSFIISALTHIFLFVILGILAVNALQPNEDEKIYEVSLMDFSAPSSVDAIPENVEESLYEDMEEIPMEQRETFLEKEGISKPITHRKRETLARTTPNKTQAATQSQSTSENQNEYQSIGNSSANEPAEETGKGESKEAEFSPPPETNAIVSPATPPSVISAVAPEYPYSAQQNGDEGTVVVRLLLNKSGGIDEATVSESSGHGSLDRAALNAAKRMRFTPGLDEYGRPVRCYVYKPFRFALQ